MKKQTIKKQSNLGKKVAIGAGVTALAVGAYLLLGPDGKKNRQKVTNWTDKMKKEVADKFKTMKNITEPIYHKVVDEVSAKYSKLKDINPKEISEVVANLKKQWKAISGEKKPIKKAITKPVKTVAKKIVSKAKKAVK